MPLVFQEAPLSPTIKAKTHYHGNIMLMHESIMLMNGNIMMMQSKFFTKLQQPP